MVHLGDQEHGHDEAEYPGGSTTQSPVKQRDWNPPEPEVTCSADEEEEVDDQDHKGEDVLVRHWQDEGRSQIEISESVISGKSTSWMPRRPST